MNDLLSNGGLRFKSVDMNNFSELGLINSTLEEINGWSQQHPEFMDNLNLSGLSKLGNIIRSQVFSGDEDLYFVFDDKQLVATTLLMPSIKLFYPNELEKFICTRSKNNPNQPKSIMTMDTAVKLLDNDGKNSCYIHYLVVNPETRGQGIGTEVIKTIEADIDFFDQATTHNAIMAMIKNPNHRCINMFANQGYESTYSSEEPDDYNMFYKAL